MVQISHNIMATALCQDCGHVCINLTNCLKYQDFNLIVENARTMAMLRKNIKHCVPEFKGKSSFLSDVPSGRFTEKPINQTPKLVGRFMTITFDPKKFSPNELSQPSKLHNYILNALWELRFLFSKNIFLVREFHRTGIPHYHMNYECHGVLEHATLILRMKYYFSNNLNNKYCIHDRTANDGALAYLTKSATSYFLYSQPNGPNDDINCVTL